MTAPAQRRLQLLSRVEPALQVGAKRCARVGRCQQARGPVPLLAGVGQFAEHLLQLFEQALIAVVVHLARIGEPGSRLVRVDDERHAGDRAGGH